VSCAPIGDAGPMIVMMRSLTGGRGG
jgi:hypothetical protein